MTPTYYNDRDISCIIRLIFPVIILYAKSNEHIYICSVYFCKCLIFKHNVAILLHMYAYTRVTQGEKTWEMVMNKFMVHKQDHNDLMNVWINLSKLFSRRNVTFRWRGGSRIGVLFVVKEVSAIFHVPTAIYETTIRYSSTVPCRKRLTDKTSYNYSSELTLIFQYNSNIFRSIKLFQLSQNYYSSQI